MQDRPKFRHVDDIVAEKESKDVNKQNNLEKGLEGLDSKERAVAMGIRKDLSVLREAYVDQIESVDLTEQGNKEAVMTLVYDVMKKLAEYDQSTLYKEIDDNFVFAIENVLNRDSLKSEQVDALKNFEGVVELAITNMKDNALKEKIARERKEALDKAEKTATENKVEEEVVERNIEQSESSMEEFMNYIENALYENLDDIRVDTDTLNRSQSMRYAYSAEDAQLDNFSGDQILLRTAINEVFEKVRFKMGFGVDELMENLDEISDREVAYIVAAYQQVKGLTVDGKFGPNTFKALEKDAGVKIVDRSTNEEAVSRFKKLGEVQSYIDLES